MSDKDIKHRIWSKAIEIYKSCNRTATELHNRPKDVQEDFAKAAARALGYEESLALR